MIDPVEFGKHMAAIVKEATAPLLARIDQLEKQVADIPEPVVPEPIDVDAIAKAAASLVPVADPVDPLPAPTVDEIAATFERRFSDLTLSWERQARDTFERAADRMPTPKDGRDAIPLDALDMTLAEDGRTVTVKMQAGETVVEKSVKLPTIIDRGVFKSGDPYDKGDAVTYGGCLWIAQTDKPEGVPGGSKDFRLAVKKGRDGKDLRESSSRHDPAKPLKLNSGDS